MGGEEAARAADDESHQVGANPDVELELGSTTVKAVARIAEGDELQRIWDAQASETPVLTGYAETAVRTIPVVVFDPVG